MVANGNRASLPPILIVGTQSLHSLVQKDIVVIFLVIKVTGAIFPQCPADLIDAPVDPGERQTLQGECNLITNAWSQGANTVLAEQRHPHEVSDGMLATWPTANRDYIISFVQS